MKPSVCFFTICGGGEDYEFLLGSIEHHAKMGRHVVLDTAPPEKARTFKRLPRSVLWIHDPIYGTGWKDFRFRAALTQSLELAREQKTDIVVQMDCDEYFSDDSPEAVFPKAASAMVSVETVHWRRDGRVYSFGDSEYHARIWPADMDVIWPANEAWLAHPDYNGNPDHHAVVRAPQNAECVRVEGHYHYHLHYGIGEKSLNEETAKSTIQGWPNGKPARIVAMPYPFWRWRAEGIKPSEAFS